MNVHLVNPPDAMDGGPACPVSAQVNVKAPGGKVQAVPVFYPGQSLHDAFFGQVLAGASTAAFDRYMSELCLAEQAESDDEKQNHKTEANAVIAAVVQFANVVASQSVHLRHIRLTHEIEQLQKEQGDNNDRPRIIRPDGRQGD